MSRGSAQHRGSSRSTSSESHVLGSTLRVRGRVIGDGDLRVEGNVEGDVQVSGTLSIAAGGVVAGQASADGVIVEGTLTGDVEAKGEVAIRAGAEVRGNMNGASVSLEEGASFTGRIEADFELPADMTSEVAAAPAKRGRR